MPTSRSLVLLPHLGSWHFALFMYHHGPQISYHSNQDPLLFRSKPLSNLVSHDVPPASLVCPPRPAFAAPPALPSHSPAETAHPPGRGCPLLLKTNGSFSVQNHFLLLHMSSSVILLSPHLVVLVSLLQQIINSLRKVQSQWSLYSSKHSAKVFLQ